jgi:hypothetical protein
VRNVNSTPAVGGQSRTIFRALPLSITAMSWYWQLHGFKLDWFDEHGKYLPYGRLKAQRGSGK